MNLKKRIKFLEKRLELSSIDSNLQALRNRCQLLLNIQAEGLEIDPAKIEQLRKTIAEIDQGIYEDPYPPLPIDWDERAAEVTRRLRAELRR